MRIATGAAALGVAAVAAWFATQHWPRPAAERAGGTLGHAPELLRRLPQFRRAHCRHRIRCHVARRTCRTRPRPSSTSCASCVAGSCLRPATSNPMPRASNRSSAPWKTTSTSRLRSGRGRGASGCSGSTAESMRTPSETSWAWRSMPPPFCRKTTPVPVSTTTRARSRLRRCSSVSSSMPRASWRTSRWESIRLRWAARFTPPTPEDRAARA